MATHIADGRGWVAEDDDGGAVVVVDERPDVRAGRGQRPLRHDVLTGVGVAL